MAASPLLPRRPRRPSGPLSEAPRLQPPRAQSRSAASGGQRAPGTHRLPGPSRGFGLGRKRGGPARKAPPTRARQGPIGARCDKLRPRPWERRPPIKRSGWRTGPMRSCRSVPAVGKERRPSAEPGGAVEGRTPGLTGREGDQWRAAGGGRGREAQGTRVNAPLCERCMNGGLCEDRRGGGGGWRPECLGPPGAGGQERQEREFTFVERQPRTRHSPRLSPTREVWAIPSVIIMIIY